MTVTNYIHHKHLPHLVEYFKKTGWAVQPTKSASEAFRAVRRDHRRPVLLYRKNDSDFLVADSRDMKILTKFMMWYNTKGEIDMDNKNLETRVADMEKDLKAIKAHLGISDYDSAEPVKAVPNRAEYDNWLKAEITKVLRNLGVPCHIKGYDYVRTAVMMCVHEPVLLQYITKGLYVRVAEEFDTTSSRVERAIRHAVELAWQRGDMDVLMRYFGNTVDATKGKTTNSEFIATLVDYIIMKGANNEMG